MGMPARPAQNLLSALLSSQVLWTLGDIANSKYLLSRLREKDPYFLSCTSFPVIEN